MMTFKEFTAIALNAKFKNCPVAEEVYNLINSKEAIKQFINYSEEGLPALCACALQIESICKNSTTFNLESDLVKQTIGRMLVRPMKDAGYTQYKSARVPNKYSKIFQYATVYKKANCYSFFCIWTKRNKITQVFFPDLSYIFECRTEFSYEIAKDILGEKLLQLYNEGYDIDGLKPMSRNAIDNILESPVYYNYLPMQVPCDLDYYKYKNCDEGKKIKNMIAKSVNITKYPENEINVERVEYFIDSLAFEVWKCQDIADSLPKDI